MADKGTVTFIRHTAGYDVYDGDRLLLRLQDGSGWPVSILRALGYTVHTPAYSNDRPFWEAREYKAFPTLHEFIAAWQHYLRQKQEQELAHCRARVRELEQKLGLAADTDTTAGRLPVDPPDTEIEPHPPVKKPQESTP